MEPTFEQAPGVGDLPRPVTNEAGASNAPLEQQSTTPEMAVGEPTGMPTAGQGQALPGDPPAQQPTLGSAPVAQPATNDPTMIADDADLIEKEWVTRAKAVVEQTKMDPYVQNKELGKVKADYIKRRYNKDIKAAGE
ncbi:hypothetical protein KC957_00780 [Candidatus Saccharibacteria bacterium]|nr:hypothetical protein [Candidatus Saccharibacteria bacterium]